MRNTEEIWRRVDERGGDYAAFSDRIWGMPELAYAERRSCAEHTAMLEEQGFRVTREDTRERWGATVTEQRYDLRLDEE